MYFKLRYISLNDIINGQNTDYITASIDVKKQDNSLFNTMCFNIPFSPDLSLAEIESKAIKMAKSELRSMFEGIEP